MTGENTTSLRGSGPESNSAESIDIIDMRLITLSVATLFGARVCEAINKPTAEYLFSAACIASFGIVGYRAHRHET